MQQSWTHDANQQTYRMQKSTWCKDQYDAAELDSRCKPNRPKRFSGHHGAKINMMQRHSLCKDQCDAVELDSRCKPNRPKRFKHQHDAKINMMQRPIWCKDQYDAAELDSRSHDAKQTDRYDANRGRLTIWCKRGGLTMQRLTWCKQRQAHDMMQQRRAHDAN